MLKSQNYCSSSKFEAFDSKIFFKFPNIANWKRNAKSKA